VVLVLEGELEEGRSIGLCSCASRGEHGRLILTCLPGLLKEKLSGQALTP